MPETNRPIASKYDRHRLEWLDQLAYELFRVTGRNQLMQCLWLYHRNVDFEELGRMIERLTALSFNRLIEPSPLPWGRPRWVKPTNLCVPLEQCPDILPRSQLLLWATQQAHKPIDPVKGPAWRMSYQRFDDGTSVVSFVGSHLVLDGMGALRAIEAAASGIDVPSPYVCQGTRGWLAGYLSDARQIFLDTPRTLAALSRIVRMNWRTPPVSKQKASRKIPGTSFEASSVLKLPAVAATIELQAWNDCALRLGGRASAMLPGFVATLASNLGRRRPSDGSISLLIPFDRRRDLSDDRALAIEFRTMIVHPADLTMDLKSMDEPLRTILRETKNQIDTVTQLLPAIAWMPHTVTTALVERLFQYNDEVPVSCSYLGELPEELARIDGAPCERVLTRAVDVNVTRTDLERSRGHLVVVASRLGQAISICIEGCQLDPTPTTVEMLRSVTAQTLAEFGLDAIIES